MDSEKLKSLHIDAQAKRRSPWSIWTIFLMVATITGASLYFAWPRASDNRRVVDTHNGQNLLAAKPAERQSASDASNPSPLPGSSASPVAPGESILTVSGYIIARERIELSPRFLGVVSWIGVKKGDTVTNGQVVVRLDDAEQRARVQEAEGRLARVQVALEKARLDYQRIRALIAENIETQQKADDLRLAVAAAEADVQRTEGELALARTYLDWTVIRSPIDGVVLEKLVDAGELVTPQSFGGSTGPSTAFLAVADLRDLQVEIELNEADVAKVTLNHSCRVSPEAYPDRHYAGYVAEMAPEANRQKGTLQIKVQIQDPDRYLTPELSARVDFLAGATHGSSNSPVVSP